MFKFPKGILIHLLMLITISSFLRFTNLNNWGLIIYDEGRYVSEARFTRDTLSWFYDFITTIPFSSDKAHDVERLVRQYHPEGLNPRTARPLHNLFTAIGFSVTDTPLAGNYVLAFFGVLTVLMTYLIALTLTSSRKVAFISGLILSLLPLHVFYSRSTLAEIDSEFIYLLSLYFYLQYYLKKSAVYFYTSGILTGLAFVTNGDRFAFFTPMLIEMFQIMLKVKNNRGDFFPSIKRFVIFISLFFIPILFSEVPYHLAFLFSHNLGVTLFVPSYFEQVLWAHSRLASFGAINSAYSVLTYPIYLLTLGGVLFFLFSLFGIAWTIKYRLSKSWLILVPVLGTLIFQTITALQATRGISPILPLLAIMCAIGLTQIKKNILFTFVLSLTLLELLIRCYFIVNYQSGFPESLEFIKTQGAGAIVTTVDTIYSAYNPGIKTINYQLTLAQNKSIADSTPKYIVLTLQKYTIPTSARNLTLKLDPVSQKIEDSCRPIFTVSEFSNKFILSEFTFEHNINILKTLDFIYRFNIPKDSQIKIYDYHDCIQLI